MFAVEFANFHTFRIEFAWNKESTDRFVSTRDFCPSRTSRRISNGTGDFVILFVTLENDLLISVMVMNLYETRITNRIR